MHNEKEVLKKYTGLILNSSAFSRLAVVGIGGSIGRREKKITDENLNDVDFFVVADSCNQKRKAESEDSLRDLTKAAFTDILYFNTKKLKRKIKNKIIDQFLYDLIKSSMILYTNPNLENPLARTKNREYKISYQSAVAVLFTRLWCLTGPYTVKSRKITPINPQLTFYQMRKAISAIIDSVLILEGLYNTSSDLKAKNFLKSDFCKKHESNIKILLNFYEGLNEDFDSIYQLLTHYYLLTMHYVIGKDVTNLINFPLRKKLLLAIFKENERRTITQIIMRHRTLKLINRFYKNRDEYFLRELSTLYKEIYSELMV